jgi:hypothetical protein
VRRALLLGDCRDGEPSVKLEVKDAEVFMLDDDVPDLAGIVVARVEGRRAGASVLL